MGERERRETKGSRVGELLEESGSGSETKLELVLKRCRDAETESKGYVKEIKAGRERERGRKK